MTPCRGFPRASAKWKNVPDSPRKARVKTSGNKMKMEEPGELCSQVTVPLEVAPVPKEPVPVLTDPPVLCKEVSTPGVTTTASEEVLVT